ncbi:MAG: glycerol-3-phosphate 1-O-acyltransferase PlsY [Gammaproteobacteria bacterium]|nr:glycerol-3-phosphate 1-O-acyltransferase PlsY [Gammaproteobacteria bacterium]
MLTPAFLIVLAYLMGSVVSAVLVCRAMGLADPRGGGSGNPGTTNVLRMHGRTAAALTLCGDVGKGLIPVLLARWLESPPWVVGLTGAAAFGGHLFPVFFRFRGGRGVATLIGVLLGVHWLLGLAFVATWLIVAAASRYSSLAALMAAVCLPFYAWLLLPDRAYLVCLSAISAVLIARHLPNIRKLINGTESKIGT